MKIRWTKNSVRFRITPAELAALERDEAVAEEFDLDSGPVWSTRVAPHAGETHLLSEDRVLVLRLNQGDVARLAAPDAEGVYFQDGATRYFIEKDFPCAHPRAAEAAEPVTDTFEAPQGFEERKLS